MRAFSLVVLALAGSACGLIEPKPGPEDEFDLDGGDSADSGIVNSLLVRTRVVDGGYESVIDAIDVEKFVAVDLDLRREADFDGGTWDIAFRRQRIRTNGGVNGDGGVQVAPMVDAGFEEVTRAPSAGYQVDLADGDDSNAEPDTVFENAEVWYDYDSRFHVLTPRQVVYVVKSTEQRFYKVRILNYYDEAGSASIFTVRWGELPP